jgi:hypothetical protein
MGGRTRSLWCRNREASFSENIYGNEVKAYFFHSHKTFLAKIVKKKWFQGKYLIKQKSQNSKKKYK